MRSHIYLLVLLVACVGSGDGPEKNPHRTTTTSTTTTTTTTITGPATEWLDNGIVTCADPSLRMIHPFSWRKGPNNETPDLAWVQGGGVGIGDLNGDGWDDIVLPGPETGGIHYNIDGYNFRSVDFTVDNSDATAVSLADYDADGDLDIFISRLNTADRLLRNDGNEVFVDVAEELGVDGGDTYSLSSAWADMDADGDLDLVVSGYGFVDIGPYDLVVEDPANPTLIYENLGDGTINEVGSTMLPQEAHDGYTFIASWTEINGDNLPDLLFINDFPQSTFFGAAAINMGTHFEWRTDLGLPPPNANMGLAVGDLNYDGLDDFVFGSWNNVNRVESSPFGVWIDSTNTSGLVVENNRKQKVAWGAEFVDIENDTDLDVVVGFGYTDNGKEPGRGDPLGQPDTIYIQTDGVFEQQGMEMNLANTRATRSVVIADFNKDGWRDIVTRDVRGSHDIHMAYCGDASWLGIRLHQETANPTAVGAQVQGRSRRRHRLRQHPFLRPALRLSRRRNR